jgi:hypothetical protein
MQFNARKAQPLRWMAALMVFAVFFSACGGEEKKTEETTTPPATEQAAPAAKPTDTMPPIDTTASSRPDPRKT